MPESLGNIPLQCVPVAQSTYKQLDTIDILNSSFSQRAQNLHEFKLYFFHTTTNLMYSDINSTKDLKKKKKNLVKS